MPELPDIELYLHALRPRIVGRVLERIRIASPFLVRSFNPPIDHVHGRRIEALRRLGKRLVWVLDDDLFIVIHLMIAGRFKFLDRGAKVPGKIGLAAFDFDNGSLILTEAGSQRRASLHVVSGESELAKHDPGGLEVLTSTPEAFGAALTRESHTLKRALTDPHLLSGIGNAYSDEILHAAKMSPMLLTSRLTPEQIASLHAHTIGVLTKWRDDLIQDTGDSFPEKVTAFREGMTAHGRYGKPCPACGTAIQRIQYATNEANYCPTCQTGGKLLADRGLSRLMKEDWPKTLDDLERRKDSQRLT
ncbi:MAG TPA: DNA-formamidopyrimidine glycosylase family protein [Vicinamibacterales bacterium]|nr:DNA-formamidopyrimidine glycosylase family protein [Vicinamibacterales bacterium]